MRTSTGYQIGSYTAQQEQEQIFKTHLEWAADHLLPFAMRARSDISLSLSSHRQPSEDDYTSQEDMMVAFLEVRFPGELPFTVRSRLRDTLLALISDGISNARTALDTLSHVMANA